MSFEFRALSQPFPRWFGPYSAARGHDSGFRIRGGLLLTVVNTPTGQQTWFAQQNDGVRLLQSLVVSRWGGGRVLLLPNGFVIKPDQAGNGIRWAIGRFSGPLILQRPDGTCFNMAAPGALQPGMHWPGPGTTGLECTLDNTGALRARSTIPTAFGEMITEIPLIPRDTQLARGLAFARPGAGTVRVRVTENGHVITKRQDAGEWASVYVGFLDPARWPHDNAWIEGAALQTPQQPSADRLRKVPEGVTTTMNKTLSDATSDLFLRRVEELGKNSTASTRAAEDKEVACTFADDGDDPEIESETFAADDDSPATPGATATPPLDSGGATVWSRIKTRLGSFLGGT